MKIEGLLSDGPVGKLVTLPSVRHDYSYQPVGNWTSRHQMTLNGKRSEFAPEDFRACANGVLMKRDRSNDH